MNIKDLILTTLHQLQSDNNITIMVAAESGSRAWGHAQEDSDWDVRFIYHRSLCDYMRLEGLPEQIEVSGPEGLDVVGWDVRKAARLALGKANAQPREWIKSPIQYIHSDPVSENVLRLLASASTSSQLQVHYRGLVRSSLSELLRTDKLKKLCYAARAAVTHNALMELHPEDVPMDMEGALAAAGEISLFKHWQEVFLPALNGGARTLKEVGEDVYGPLLEVAEAVQDLRPEKVSTRAGDWAWMEMEDAIMEVVR